MHLFRRNRKKAAQLAQSTSNYDSVVAYDRHLAALLQQNPGDRDLAFAQAVGSLTTELFRQQGDQQVAVLKSHGLSDGMAIFDLGCGCGRTAQALQRSGWSGSYTGADIITGFIDELKARCPEYTALVHRHPSIPAGDASLDMLFHWSVFTHLSPEECYIYMVDIFRAMKPGGRMVFSFLELTEPQHHATFFGRAERLAAGIPNALLDTFLHRDWICLWGRTIGYLEPEFIDGWDDSRHSPFWQTLVRMTKPLA
jgi:ubiquinone/menaquinone biosynthesis C-methylase UbiE